ncbi:Short transient receptor putative channel 4-associated protein [Saguinus oedipus]|uniref:Short transient receptor putative channel 4-associated protein n=1 Tax=Saguinus oedipus TaxID=9490 RepID=A0ABQ9VKI9_SAGOE|nr:Short transient receptor putative channel 4-associated protein [Saguinus oedipus]
MQNLPRSQTEGVTKRLAEKNDFVIFLFTLMTSKKTFLQTATLIEDILGVKKALLVIAQHKWPIVCRNMLETEREIPSPVEEMIRLDEVPNLSSLVSNFDQQQLANFCRILAVTISEMDTGNDDKHTLLAKNAQQKKSLSLGPSAAEINQGYTESDHSFCSIRLRTHFSPFECPEKAKLVDVIKSRVGAVQATGALFAGEKKFKNKNPAINLSLSALLSIPGFVERLCKLATRKVSESTGTASFLQELEEWYTWLDNALVLDALMRVANEESEHNQEYAQGERRLRTGSRESTAGQVRRVPSMQGHTAVHSTGRILRDSPSGASEENGLPHTSARTQLPQSMKIMHEIMYKLEVLYVLCVLLMGRQRNQEQAACLCDVKTKGLKTGKIGPVDVLEALPTPCGFRVVGQSPELCLLMKTGQVQGLQMCRASLRLEVVPRSGRKGP